MIPLKSGFSLSEGPCPPWKQPQPQVSFACGVTSVRTQECASCHHVLAFGQLTLPGMNPALPPGDGIEMVAYK